MTIQSWLVADLGLYMVWSLGTALRIWRGTDRSVPFLEFVVGASCTPMRRAKNGWVFWPAQYDTAKAEYWRAQVARWWRAVVPFVLLQVSIVVIVAIWVLPQSAAGSP